MHVYILQRPDGLIKIGFSTDPTKRLRSLETQGGFDAASAWVSVPVENAKAVEAKAHEKIADHRVIGEWFEVGFDQALHAVLDAMRGKEDRPSRQTTACIDADTLPQRLLLALKSKGVSQKALASALQVSEGTVSHWIASRHSASIEQVAQIATVLGVSPAWLAFGHGPVDESTLHAADILAPLTPVQRAQALRMLEAFAASCVPEVDE